MGAGNREDPVVPGELIFKFLINSMTDIFVFSPCIEVDWSQEFDRFKDHDKNGNDMALKLKRSAFTTQFSYPSQVPLGLHLKFCLI